MKIAWYIVIYSKYIPNEKTRLCLGKLKNKQTTKKIETDAYFNHDTKIFI